MHEHEKDRVEPAEKEAPMVASMRQYSQDNNCGWTEAEIAEYAERFWNGILISMRIGARLMREEDARREANRQKLVENGDL